MISTLLPLPKWVKDILGTTNKIHDEKLSVARITNYDRAMNEITADRMHNLDFRDPVYKLKQIVVTTSSVITIPSYVEWINLIVGGGGGGGGFSRQQLLGGSSYGMYGAPGTAGEILTYKTMPLFSHQIDCLIGSKGLGQLTSAATDSKGGNTTVQINGLEIVAKGGGSVPYTAQLDPTLGYPHGEQGANAVLNTSIAASPIGYVAGGGGGYFYSTTHPAVLPYAKGADGAQGIVLIEYLERIQGS